MPIQNEIIFNPNHPKDNKAKQMPKRVSLFELPVLLSFEQNIAQQITSSMNLSS